MTKTQEMALQELGLDEQNLAAKAAQMDALVSEPREFHCPNCGITNSKWTREIRKGAEVKMSTLRPNQRVGYGTGADDHALYTHSCVPATVGEQLKASLALVDGDALWLAKAKAETIALDSPEQAEFRKQRKPRKDKGIPKGPKNAQEPPSTLAVQCARLKDLYETKQSRLAQLDAAQDNMAELLGSIDAITAEIEAAWNELQGVK